MAGAMRLGMRFRGRGVGGELLGETLFGSKRRKSAYTPMFIMTIFLSLVRRVGSYL